MPSHAWEKPPVEPGRFTFGFELESEAKTGIRSSDVINVLAFAKDGSVLDYAEHSRNKGGFAQLRGKCLDRDMQSYWFVTGRMDGLASFNRLTRHLPHRRSLDEAGLRLRRIQKGVETIRDLGAGVPNGVCPLLGVKVRGPRPVPRGRG